MVTSIAVCQSPDIFYNEKTGNSQAVLTPQSAEDSLELMQSATIESEFLEVLSQIGCPDSANQYSRHLYDCLYQIDKHIKRTRFSVISPPERVHRSQIYDIPKKTLKQNREKEITIITEKLEQLICAQSGARLGNPDFLSVLRGLPFLENPDPQIFRLYDIAHQRARSRFLLDDLVKKQKVEQYVSNQGSLPLLSHAFSSSLVKNGLVSGDLVLIEGLRAYIENTRFEQKQEQILKAEKPSLTQKATVKFRILATMARSFGSTELKS